MLQGSIYDLPWEVGLMEWLQAQLGSAGIAVLSFLSMLGEEVILVLVLGFLYWGYHKQLAKTAGLSVLLGLVWAPTIKNVFLRRRPYFDHPGIRTYRAVDSKADLYDIAAQGYSFPSMHSANATSLYGSLALAIRKTWSIVLAVLLPLLVGISRVAVGAHYPTDVLAGWLIGIVAMLLVWALQKRIHNTLLLYGILLVTALPGLFICQSADYFSGLGLLIGFMAGTLFEEKRVRFESTRSPGWILLRLIGGIAVYFVLNTLLKLPFSHEFLESGDYAAWVVRGVRYAVIAFVDFGVYPMIFSVVEKHRKTPDHPHDTSKP